MTYFAKDPVYVLSFEPRWGEDYKGTIYVSMDDFAVLRMDFENVKSVWGFDLFGVSIDAYKRSGRIILSKNNQGKEMRFPVKTLTPIIHKSNSEK